MTGSSSSSIHSLLRHPHSDESGGVVKRPPSRWVLRYVLPILMIVVAGVMVVYAARDTLLPTVDVEIVPVVAKAAPIGAGDLSLAESQVSGRAEPQIIAQAPGWIEPDPFAVTVQSLVPGVVEEVFVFEGEHVEEGQVIATVIAEDFEIALRRARAELAELDAAVDRARAARATAEARRDELREELERKRELADVGGVSRSELTSLAHRLRSLEGEIDAAAAAVRQALAALERQRVTVDEAELHLSRTVIRAPTSGIVLSRSVVPGTRLAIAGDGPGEAHFPGVVRLYDPARLQVRADVALADASKVGLGTPAIITTEAMPERTFRGEVTRIVHQADIQRNTVQVKVRIHDPSSLLKPDMLTRVRFLSHVEESGDSVDRMHSEGPGGNAGSLRLYAAQSAIISRDGEHGRAWVVEPRGRRHAAALRNLVLGHDDGEFIHVREGLQPGDRLIVNAPSHLKQGSRVRAAERGVRGTISEENSHAVH